MYLQVDIILAILLILLGSQIAYAVDEVFGLTPRLATWLERMLG